MGKGVYSREHMLGENASAWKGSEASYSALHKWVQSRLGKPRSCEDCKSTNAIKYEWANISGKYLRDLSDWKRLCSTCHHKMDDLTNKGWVTRKKKYGKWGKKEVPQRKADGTFIKTTKTIPTHGRVKKICAPLSSVTI